MLNLVVLDKIQGEMHLEKITDFFPPLVNKVMGKGRGAGGGTRVSAWFHPQQRFNTWLLNPGTLDTGGWVRLGSGAWPVQCRVLSRIPRLPVVPSPLAVTTRNVSRHCKWPLAWGRGAVTPLAESHWLRVRATSEGPASRPRERNGASPP